METSGSMTERAEHHIEILLAAGFNEGDMRSIANGGFDGVMSDRNRHARVTPDAWSLRQIVMAHQREFRDDPRTYVDVLLSHRRNAMRETSHLAEAHGTEFHQ